MLAACCCLAACEKVSPENTPGGSTPGGSTPAGEIPSAVKIQSVLFRVKDTGEWVKSLELESFHDRIYEMADDISDLTSEAADSWKSEHYWIDI